MSRTIAVVGAAIFNNQKCLAAQRSSSMSNPLKWEFPGGKVELGETSEQALKREILEELGIHIEIDDWLAQGHGLNDRGDIIQLDVFAARHVSGQIQLSEHLSAGWFDHKKLSSLEWDTPDLPALQKVIARLQSQ